MNVIRRRGWEIPDRFATPEHLAFSRRTVLTGAASALALAPYAANAQRLTDVVNLPADVFQMIAIVVEDRIVRSVGKENGNITWFWHVGRPQRPWNED